MSKIESKVQAEVIKYLNDNKIWHYRQHAHAERYGLPDIIACYRGYFVGIELKREKGGRASGLQQKTLATIREQGGYGRLIRSVWGLQQLFGEIDAIAINYTPQDTVIINCLKG